MISGCVHMYFRKAGYLPLKTYLLPMCNYTQLLILTKALPCVVHGTVRPKRTCPPASKDLFCRFGFLWAHVINGSYRLFSIWRSTINLTGSSAVNTPRKLFC